MPGRRAALRDLWIRYRRAVGAGQGGFVRRAALTAFQRRSQDWVGDLRRAMADAEGGRHAVYDRLAEDAAALHEQLGGAYDAGWSILVVSSRESPDQLATCLASCLRQSASRIEVRVARRRPLDRGRASALHAAERARPGVLHWHELPGLSEAAAFRTLIDAARFDHLLLVAPDDWLRPDLLYRYALVRAGEPEPAHTVITSAGRFRTAGGAFLPPDPFSQDPGAQAPLLFDTSALESAAEIPRAAVLGWRPPDDGAPWEAVAHAWSQGCRLVHLPVPMRARLAPSAPVRHSLPGLRRHYAALDGDWRVESDGRVRPPPAPATGIAVIIPYRDQRELTLRCVRSVLDQAVPALELIALDNGSVDRSIASALIELGVRVLRKDEPFNFSRLCNAGAASTTAPLLLFLNNDVALAPASIAELAAWAILPFVGLVGCLLERSDGRLQHGGVERSSAAPAGEMGWEDVEWGLRPQRLARARRLRVVDAVSAACAMTRRSVFESVGGFDDRHYPVTFGDLDYAMRIRQRELLCVYTPYARGLHEESASRRYERLEDFEGSAWWGRRLGRSND